MQHGLAIEYFFFYISSRGCSTSTLNLSLSNISSGQLWQPARQMQPSLFNTADSTVRYLTINITTE